MTNADEQLTLVSQPGSSTLWSLGPNNLRETLGLQNRQVYFSLHQHLFFPRCHCSLFGFSRVTQTDHQRHQCTSTFFLSVSELK